MRLAQEARTRKRLEELDYAAYAALGDDQSMQIWVLQNEVVAEAKEPWSDNGTPQLNVSSTYGTTEEHNHDASCPIYAPTRVERNCESSSAKTNLLMETPD